MPHDVVLEPVAARDKLALARLLELYVYDYSEYMDWDVDDRGEFGYEHLDDYWTDADRHPFFIRVDGRLAGFALVHSGTPHDMAEFFVMRKYRRRGIATVAARLAFSRFPGEWQVRQMPENRAGTSFWHNAIPVPFREELRDGRPFQFFLIEA